MSPALLLYAREQSIPKLSFRCLTRMYIVGDNVAHSYPFRLLLYFLDLSYHMNKLLENKPLVYSATLKRECRKRNLGRLTLRFLISSPMADCRYTPHQRRGREMAWEPESQFSYLGNIVISFWIIWSGIISFIFGVGSILSLHKFTFKIKYKSFVVFVGILILSVFLSFLHTGERGSRRSFRR